MSSQSDKPPLPDNPRVDGHALHRVMGKSGDPSTWIRYRIASCGLREGVDYTVTVRQQGRVRQRIFSISLRGAYLMAAGTKSGHKSPVTRHLREKLEEFEARKASN